MAARSRLDVDVALGEIVHFLTHDERLPGRTRKAVQFLHGLREQMVLADTHHANPELFDCPFTAASVEQYTFKEVRQQYGEAFRDKFWPVFQVRISDARRELVPRVVGRRTGARCRQLMAGNSTHMRMCGYACGGECWEVLRSASAFARVATQAFNCVLPAHAPEEAPPAQTPAAALASFLPTGK